VEGRPPGASDKGAKVLAPPPRAPGPLMPLPRAPGPWRPRPGR